MTKEQRKVKSLIASIWSRFPGWMNELARKHPEKIDEAFGHACACARHWMGEHPYGSCNARSIRILGVFLHAMDEVIPGAWNSVPECVRQSIEKVERGE